VNQKCASITPVFEERTRKEKFDMSFKLAGVRC
jgi:hypothetical protein